MIPSPSSRPFSLPAAGLVLACLAAAIAPPLAARPISPYIVGQNLWDGTKEGAAAHRLWPALRSAGFRLIRIGGIHYEERMPDNETIRRLVDSVRAIGAEPLVQVSTHLPPERAADLVRHLNLATGRKVRFWSIGNEPTCDKAADAATVAGIAAGIRSRASAMKQVDPSIRIAVGDECYWRPELYDPLVGGGQDVTGKDPSGRFYADIVAFHTYAFPGADKTRAYTRQEVLDRAAPTVRNFLAACTTRAALANARHGRSGADALVCALTEFNITYWNIGANTLSGVGTRSFLNGQFMAEVIGDGMRMGAFAVLPWSIYESFGRGTESDLGMFDGQGPFTPRPSFHHASLAGLHLRGEAIAATEAEPLLKAFGSRQADTAALLLMNQEASAGRRLAIALGADAPAGRGVPVRLAAGFPGVHADSLGPQETLLLRFHRSGSLLSRIRYSLAMAEAGLGPRRDDFPLPVAVGPSAGAFAGPGPWDGPVHLEARALRGPAPDAGAWEVRLFASDGVLAGSARAEGGTWRLARPGPGLHLLVFRSGAVVRSRRVFLP